jgi:hypothetical protein
MQNRAKQSQKGSLEIKIKKSQGEKYMQHFWWWGGGGVYVDYFHLKF